MTDLDVRTFLDVHPPGTFRGNELPYTLFHDETNNIGKLTLSEQGFFSRPELQSFVLGGIVLLPDQALPDFSALRSRLSSQKSAREIKFKHVASGSFLEVLASQKLSDVLGWLLEHQIRIHYFNLNVLFWSLADIVDAIVGEQPIDPHLRLAMKSELHRLVRRDNEGFCKMLAGFRYPAIERSRSSEFVEVVGAFLDHHRKRSFNIPSEQLRRLCRRAHKIDELPFLHEGEPGSLIENFRDFFFSPLMVFHRAEHIFDREHVVQRLMAEYRVVDGTRVTNYRFSDSKSEIGIQLSDIVVGLLGRLFGYVESTTSRRIREDRAALDPVQLQTLIQLSTLLEVSMATCNAFAHHVTAIESQLKARLLLEGPDAVEHPLWDHGDDDDEGDDA